MVVGLSLFRFRGLFVRWWCCFVVVRCFRRGWCSGVSWGCFVVVCVLVVHASPEVVVCVPPAIAGVELPPVLLLAVRFSLFCVSCLFSLLCVVVCPCRICCCLSELCSRRICGVLLLPLSFSFIRGVDMWWWCVESCSPHHRRTLSCVLCVCRGCCRWLMAFSCFSGCYSKGFGA